MLISRRTGRPAIDNQQFVRDRHLEKRNKTKRAVRDRGEITLGKAIKSALCGVHTEFYYTYSLRSSRSGIYCQQSPHQRCQFDSVMVFNSLELQAFNIVHCGGLIGVALGDFMAFFAKVLLSLLL